MRPKKGTFFLVHYSQPVAQKLSDIVQEKQYLLKKMKELKPSFPLMGTIFSSHGVASTSFSRVLVHICKNNFAIVFGIT